jgi:hypothetical protein
LMSLEVKGLRASSYEICTLSKRSVSKPGKLKVHNNVCFESVAGLFRPKAAIDGRIRFRIYFYSGSDRRFFVWNARKAKFRNI